MFFLETTGIAPYPIPENICMLTSKNHKHDATLQQWYFNNVAPNRKVKTLHSTNWYWAIQIWNSQN